MAMRAGLYLRVSTNDGSQSTENQRIQLSEFCTKMKWDAVAVFDEVASGKSLDRPAFKEMMRAASRRDFDVLVFWDLSRLSRSGALDVLTVLQQLRVWGVAYRSYQEPYLDSLGPFSEVVVSLLAAVGKMEREKIRERTLAGLARARKAGRVGGRPKATDDFKLVSAAAKLRASGASVRRIARELGVAPGTATKLIREALTQ